MTRSLTLMSRMVLGQGAALEDKDPTPQEFRVMRGAKSAAPVEAKPLPKVRRPSTVKTTTQIPLSE